MKRTSKHLYLITIAYFASGFIHMGLALFAFVCIFLPFALLKYSEKNIWCSSYCPRSYWLDVFGNRGLKRKTPLFLVGSNARRYVLIYFCINMFFVFMSTVMVTLGKIAPMDVIRFFIIIPTDWRLPQLWNPGAMPPIMLHLSYRLYSVMLSSTIAGTALAILYKPRTWCAICPIKTTTALIGKS